MERTMPFKLIDPSRDTKPLFKRTIPEDMVDSAIAPALYMQMVHTMCSQDVINQFFHKLASPDDELFTKLKSLVMPEGNDSHKFELAEYLLNTYMLIDYSEATTDTDFASWFIDALDIIYGSKVPDIQETNPIWETVVKQFPTAPKNFAILGLFTPALDKEHIVSTLKSQIPSKSLASVPGTENLVKEVKNKDLQERISEITEKRERQELKAAYAARISALFTIADICSRIFDKYEHEPDPETLATLVEDIVTPLNSKPTIPSWVKRETVDIPKFIDPELSKAPEEAEPVTPSKKLEPAVKQKQEKPVIQPNKPVVPQEHVEPKKVEPKAPPKPVEPVVTPKKVEPAAQAPTPAIPSTTPAAPTPEIPAQADNGNNEPSEDISDIVAADTPTTDVSMGTEVPAATSEPESAPSAPDEDIGEVVAGDLDEPSEASEVVTGEDTDTVSTGSPTDTVYGSDIATNAGTVKRPSIPQKVLMEIFAHAGTRDQVADAVHLVEQDIIDNTPNSQFLVRYVPGVTSEIVKDILVNRTASGKYINRQTGKSGNTIPHTNLTGGTTFTSGTRSRTLGPVEVPSGFAQENSSVLWDEPVITSMGFPFINFGAPEIYTILKEKDESKVKKAYKKLKKQLKKIGLDSPIKVLKDFKQAKGVRCALNRITVDAEEILGKGNEDVIASVYPRVDVGMRSSIGSVSLTRDFIVEMYKVLSPTKGAKIYMDTLGMDEDEYANILDRDGKPPLYIFIPKERLAFSKAPAGFIARLLTSNNKPTLIEAKIGTHFGGFVMPFKTTRLLFTNA